jgi:translation initiation factor IF-2
MTGNMAQAGFFPPPGYGYPPPLPPSAGGIPPYPGPASIYQDPRFQYGPSFDGLYSHGLTTNQYLNSLFEDTNMTQHQIYSAAGVGYPQNPPYPPLPGMLPGPMPPGPPPMVYPPPPHGGKGGGGHGGGDAGGGDHGGGGGTNAHSASNNNGVGQNINTYV